MLLPGTLLFLLRFDAKLCCKQHLAALQVGSIFEYANKNAIFGVVKPDSFLWAPILLFFAVTGFPSAGASEPHLTWNLILSLTSCRMRESTS